MKRVVTIAFSILMLCSLLLLANAGIAKAGNTAYAIVEYWAQVTPTIDGHWSSTDEWTDGPPIAISDNANFTYVVDTSLGSGFYMIQIIIEFYNDTTNDAEDYWQINLDTDNSGGTAPEADCFKIDIVGHTTLSFYQGNGTGWDDITAGGEIDWFNSISDSPTNSTPHWILELQFNKEAGLITVPAPPNAMRIAVYDESNADAGVEAWAPDSDPDVPNEYGVIATYSQTPYVPEAFSIGIVVLLSSAAVVVSFYFLRKRPKTESGRVGKTREINYTS